MGSDRIGIIGSGNTARALAAYLSHQGHSVCVYTRHPEKLETIRRRGHIEATGLLEGMFPIEEVTSEPERLARQCGTLFVANVTTAYLDVAAALAPYLREHHALVLFSSKLCGSPGEGVKELERRDPGEGVKELERRDLARQVAGRRKAERVLRSPPAPSELPPLGMLRRRPGIARATPAAPAARCLSSSPSPLVHLRAGTQQQPPLEAPGGDEIETLLLEHPRRRPTR
ncbi:NAD(P)-binding domain-containing protein [Cystobacter ferrugineus]|uniref:Pyrroline-5-carboxylate reductase catalytic N-terminal domain-containing protein n=1 Tax=Cystobacter ferrugineus TaxID=83449 RepID=A0A1L9BKD0_9BACT|nr:NAD(P)-binding domain-containing protein [Cystobacter ferrugineus]OJH42774.1 hypothetical protein BON30_06250 [Cystobacter ferrugineus]